MFDKKEKIIHGPRGVVINSQRICRSWKGARFLFDSTYNSVCSLTHNFQETKHKSSTVRLFIFQIKKLKKKN